MPKSKVWKADITKAVKKATNEGPKKATNCKKAKKDAPEKGTKRKR